MISKKPVVIFLGPQGSGKGTQGKKLSEKLGVPYLEAGKLLRDEIASGSDDGKYISSVITDGNLLPNEYISSFMEGKIINAIKENGGVIVDGFPRRLPQADAFEKIVKPTNVILINIPEEESILRLSARRMCKNDGRIYNLITNPPKKENICDDCGSNLEQREDDKPQAIKRRLLQYHTDTKPLVGRYEDEKILKTIDGTCSIEEVEKEIWKIFE